MTRKGRGKKWQKMVKIIAGPALLVATFFLLFGSFSTIWAVTLPVPDFEQFFEKQITQQSTKIYDRTGQILLYDVRGVRHTPIPFASIPDNIKKATLAIEDAGFYQHKGFQPSSIARAFLTDVLSGSFSQGGSTITQQVVKNSLLTNDRTITRKVKELVLSIKLEKTMTKDEILNVYLNQTPYGGNIYGIQEAVKAYYKKDVSQITLAEAAYLAAMPQAPNFYSPYGANKNKLDQRKNLVLSRMLDVGFITKAEYDQAKQEKVVFYEKINQGIKAPHFVEWLNIYLNGEYGEDNIKNNDYKVISTIDWDLQQKVEELAKKYGESNEKNYNAKNNSVVVIDPKTGQILALTGSRDYFNKEIQGNFNVATAYRQPGSSFKPFVYATAFNKGYTDRTVVFDLKTEFNTGCSPTGQPLSTGAVCYMPKNYDDKFVGPITLRNALGQSRNIPAIKTLYLAGINDSLATAKKMGVTSLLGKNQYGLTLVLGGGEVSLLEMTGAYGVFATEGVRHETTGILKITDPQGKTVEEYNNRSENVLPVNTSRLISDILSDDEARTPAYGQRSILYFADRDVAVKTGTTNDYRDAWTIGYSPNMVVGAWAGNNDNTSMEKKVAGYIIAPLWHDIMIEALKKMPDEKFVPPMINYVGLKPILRGSWQGGQSNIINGQEILNINVHSILYWLDKNNPLGPAPSQPGNDPQLRLWEYPVQQWLKNKTLSRGGEMLVSQPDTEQKQLLDQVNFLSPTNETTYGLNEDIRISLLFPSNLKLSKIDYFVDEIKVASPTNPNSDLFINALESEIKSGQHSLKAIIYNQNGDKTTKTVNFTLNQ